jgi:DNA-binding NtrC family response regulator
MKTMKKILVIDDDKDFGLALSFFFADKPFQLFLAYSLSDGMAIMEKERPEHIFLDNNLPDGSGWAKTAFILATYPNARLNLISAWGVPNAPLPASRILEKPISLENLLSCLG